MENITVEELKARIDSGGKINLLYVREPDEYAAFSMDAILIPPGKIQSMAVDEIEDMKDEELIHPSYV